MAARLAKNQRNSWLEVGSTGSGQRSGLGMSPTFWRKPSSVPHDGGTGRCRPGRRSNTGSSTMPRNALPNPAMTNWIRTRLAVAAAAPSRAITRRRGAFHTSTIAARPQAITRSRRNRNATPNRTPETMASRTARRSSELARACRPTARPSTPRPTPPVHAKAVSPAGGSMMTIASSAHTTATLRPHQRATKYTPNATPACWSRPNRRSTSSLAPNTL